MKKMYLATVLMLLSGYLMAQSMESSNPNRGGRNSNNQSSVDPKIVATDIELTDYPIYEDTGNKKLDNAGYQAAKLIWVKENHEGPISMKSLQNGFWDFENMEGFPKYINNGNPELDKATYNASIRLWFKRNPAMYKRVKATTK
jgi:hypothetical protein